MDNKFCVNCGNALKDNEKFCGKCGKQLIQSSNELVQTNNSFVPIILGIISLLLYFLGGVAFLIFASYMNNSLDRAIELATMFPTTGIITMIIGREKKKKSKFLKVVMWIIIGFVIASIALVVLFIAIVLYFVMFRGLQV